MARPGKKLSMSEKMTSVACDHCGTAFLRVAKEVARCLKRNRNMYCSGGCQSEARIVPKERLAVCIRCGVDFTSKKTRGKWSGHCSRSCASAGSVTDLRRDKARLTGALNSKNLLSVSETMKLREAWKYGAIQNALACTTHEFEYPYAGYVFDLALFDFSLFVEFDPPPHRIDGNQIAADATKDRLAREGGFDVLRIPVEPNAAIPVSVLEIIKLRTSTVDGNICGPGSRIPAPPPTPGTEMLRG